VKGFVNDLNGQRLTLQLVGKRCSVSPAPSHVNTGLVCIGIRDHVDWRAVENLFHVGQHIQRESQSV